MVSMDAVGGALQGCAPGVDFGRWRGALEQAFERFEVNTPRRVAAALGQFLVETGRAFGETVEDLYYSSAERLVMIYPREIPDLATAAAYVGNPEALGNFVYAGRDGNGDVASGDGYRFRGRGLIQVTGRAAYARLAAALGMPVELTPTYCATPTGAAMSGCWWLAANGCLPLADGWEISAITRTVNGPGMAGAGERLGYANEVLRGLGS